VSFLLSRLKIEQLPPERQRHLRLTRSVLLIILAIGAIFTLDYLLRGDLLAALLILMSMGILAAALLDVRRTGRTTIANHLALGCYLVVALGISISIENFVTPLAWLLLIPLLSGVLMEARETLIWSVLALLVLWLAFFLAPNPLLIATPFHTFHVTGMLITITMLVFWVLREHELARHDLEVSHAELRELANQLIRTEERTRNTLVTDLHEGVLQEIFALRLFLTASGTDNLDRSLDQLDRIDSQLRSLVVSLHPEIPDQASLGDALAQLALRAPTHLGVTVELEAPTLPRFPDSTEKALFLTIRELLFNAARYANTDTIRLRLVQHAALLTVHIEDDGVGFSPSERSASGSGMGLRMCRERIQSISGRMVVDSQLDHGTHITLTVPLPDPGAAAGYSGVLPGEPAAQ
jgi:signal transduction histidine kinase